MTQAFTRAERNGGDDEPLPRRSGLHTTGSIGIASGSPNSTWRSGATPSRPGASTARPRPTSTCCATRASTSKRAAAACRPPSWPPGADSGPVIGSYAEYDAVPGNSQQAGAVPGAARGPAPLRRRAHRPPLHARRRRAGRLPGREGGDGAIRHRGATALLRRAGGEGLRLETGPRRQGLLRQRRRLHLLPPDERQHDRLGDALRLLLERGLHLRVRRAGAVDQQGPLAQGARRQRGQPAQRGPHARRHRRHLPDVHADQVHQGGDVPAHGHLDPQRVHPGRRRRHLRQPSAPLEPDPVLLARPHAGDPGADLPGAGEQRQAGRRAPPAAAPTCSG